MSSGQHRVVRLGWLLLVATLLSAASSPWIPAEGQELTWWTILLPWAGLFGLLGLLGTCALGLSLAFVLTRSKRDRPRKRADLLTATVFALPLLFFPPLLVALVTIPVTEHKVRARSFRALAERSQPLVDAIARYHRHQDFPPSSLAALVPEYLDEIPGTGIDPYPEYRYLVLEEGSRFETPWELRVPCGRGLLNWDVFVYWPSEEYPSAMYGGTVERMGAWAYVHE
ncbi:MAG: hypothetical protein O7B99_12895 [Planctomycetota bacterium]|nr:hypothetical protein [Planctomycetota bacterium]